MDGEQVFELLDQLDGRTRAASNARFSNSQAPQQSHDSGYSSTQHHAFGGHRSAELESYDDHYQLDDFDRAIISQPYIDRRLQAEYGAARLSLAPNTSAAGASARTRRASRDSACEEHGSRYTNRTSHDFNMSSVDLSRFAYTENPPGSSSPRGMPSSPAFKARERRDQNRHLPQTQTKKSRKRSAEQSVSHQQHERKDNPPRPKPIERPPVVQGIQLVSRSELPDRFRTVFPFPLFNAVQSKSFAKVYRSNDNFVLSSPTGSGKTVVLELAICRAVNEHPHGQFKIVYQAPTKALCAERQADWAEKFGPLDLKCAELTGDTKDSELKDVQHASIIITTPEKWDSLTRKWRDHEKLMRLVKLFLIDEVHFLNDDRGATLEAIVSRMKSVSYDMRFVALSATIPNLEDIASWLGRSASFQDEPAPMERFGEEFRPVALRKYVCAYKAHGNDFAFDASLTNKLFEVITKYSQRKPIMIFCFTRKSALTTAKALSAWWSSQEPRSRYWDPPGCPIPISDTDLKHLLPCGIAFHHAGLDTTDRIQVEKAYLAGEISVICCTSTLAVGVNLPCHFAIIKNTVSYQAAEIAEYSDLEVMQMLGRAGRPQFDKDAVGVIMTTVKKANHYEKMVTGSELVESRLHLNLIEHLNAEISLGTITDLRSAKKWLSGTFLSTRLRRNPEYYRMEGTTEDEDFDERIAQICSRDIELLQRNELVASERHLKSTEYGEAMARYYVQFNTMCRFVSLGPQAKVSEILSVLVQAAEYKDLRLRSFEKAVYKEINGSNLIRFPLKVDLNSPAHKTSTILQMVLGGVEYPQDEKAQNIKIQFQTDTNIVFRHANRLARCIIDCQIYRKDAVGARNALFLERSFSAKAWDDSALQITQIERLGAVAARKLVQASIKSIEDLESIEASRIEALLKRNPPFGLQVHTSLAQFPKPRVGIHLIGHSLLKNGEGVNINLKAEVGFLNTKASHEFKKRPIFVCFVAERSDGYMIHFARIKASKISTGAEILFSTTLSSAQQSVSCYVMCESIAGTLRSALLKHGLPASIFPKQSTISQHREEDQIKAGPKISRRRVDATPRRKSLDDTSDEFKDDDLDDIDDADLFRGVKRDLEFEHIDNFSDPVIEETRRNTAANKNQQTAHTQFDEDKNEWQPTRLANGKWACNHLCKNKLSCKHLCCREGLDRPPKPPTKRPAETAPPGTQKPFKARKTAVEDKNQTKLDLTVIKPRQSSGRTQRQEIDLTGNSTSKKTSTSKAPSEYKNLQRLHANVQSKSGNSTTNIPNITKTKPAYSYAEGSKHTLSFLPSDGSPPPKEGSSDYGDISIDDISDVLSTQSGIRAASPNYDMDIDDDVFNEPFPEPDEEELEFLEAAMIGLADSQELQSERIQDERDGLAGRSEHSTFDLYEDPLDEPSTSVQHPVADMDDSVPHHPPRQPTHATPTKTESLFVTDSSSSGPKSSHTTSSYFKSMPPYDPVRADEDVENTDEPAAMNETIAEEKVEEGQPEAAPNYDEVDAWLLAEFGDIVEFT